MNQKFLSGWLKWIIAGVALFGIVATVWIVPFLGMSMKKANPEFAHCFVPWLLFIWITAVPCFAALGMGWRIAANIGADQSFTYENADLLKKISMLAAGDGAFFFVGNIVFLLLGMNHPGIMLASVAVAFAAIAISVAAAMLSHLARNAADLKQQCDLTI